MTVQIRKKKNVYKINNDLIWWMQKSGYLDKILPNYTDKTKEDCFTLLELAGELAGEEFASRMSENDRYGEKNHSLAPGIAKSYQTLVDTGFLGMTLHSGMHFPFFTSVAVYELIAQADPALMVRYGLSEGVAETVERFGSAEVQEKYISGILNGKDIGAMVLTEADAGSDLRTIKTKATETKEGIFLDGTKQFISNCDATLHLVLARDADTFTETMGTMKGLSMYLTSTEENTPNHVQNSKKEDKVGIHASLTGTLVYDHASAHLIGKKGAGLEQMLHLMHAARLGVAAQAVGTMQAATVEAQHYAKERRIRQTKENPLGTALCDAPGMKNILDDISLTVLAARSLLYEAAYCVEMKDKEPAYEKRAMMLTFLAKYYAAEECIRCCRLGLQVHGGSGFVKEYLAEQFVRDSLVFPIYEGTSQIQALSYLGGVAREKGQWTWNHYKQGIKGFFSLQKEGRSVAEMERMLSSALLTLGKKGKDAAQYHAERFARLAANYEIAQQVIAHPTRPRYEELRDNLLPRLLASSRKEYDEMKMLK